MAQATKTDQRLLGFARTMRHEPATAERLLWGALRNRQVDGWKFRRQVPIQSFIVDFVCSEAALIIELDGETHGMRTIQDARRDDALGSLGYQIIRLPNAEVYANLAGVIDTILSRLPNPHPAAATLSRKRARDAAASSSDT